MDLHGSKPETSVAAALAVALLAALALACSVARDERPADPGATVEPAERDAASEVVAAPSTLPDDARKPEPEGELRKLRALGYVLESGPAAGQAPAPAAPGTGKPDAAGLSQLDYQSAQSLNQRANEALDYLGVRSFEPSEPDAKDQRRPGRDAAVDAKLARKVAGGLADEADRADAFRQRAELESTAEERPADSPALRFLRERRSLEGLAFQPASGYWANTYVPGDPVLRWLQSRLERRNREALEAFASRPLLLDAAAQQTPQPFDPPSGAALSVFLQADRRGLEGESRMLVQVGLQGADRHGGLRPAMSVGIVLDARGGVPTGTAASMRALLDAFLAAKDVGDRFSLRMAGQPGAGAIAPEAFRYGPVSLAMARLVEPRGAQRGEPPLELEEAVRRTIAELRRNGDPAAPLGSSMVLLVTSQPLGPLAERIAAMAHESAVAGVAVSAVGIGDGVQVAEIERIALAGQGNRRLMHAASEAEQLVERELSSLSGVIARAVRLRIRLAPGVKLVEVVGSEPLDASGAQQVRRAEQSIDRRLARNLGIEADRGEDEEGIQIVLPTFHGGDAHAVLLDVVAPGPGPIADVTVRYKDLVYLRNGVARANLTLGRSDDPPGPLERNVVKNLLAIRLSETLKQAGRELMAGADARAIASVREFQALLEGLRRDVPGFGNDAGLANDAAMLGEYLAVLGTDALRHDEPRQLLADSLQVSGYFKTVPRRAPEFHASRR